MVLNVTLETKKTMVATCKNARIRYSREEGITEKIEIV